MLPRHLRSLRQILFKRCISTTLIPLETRSVPPASLQLGSRSSEFLSFAASTSATPLVFRSPQNASDHTNSNSAASLMEALSAGEDRLIELELGQYNSALFERVPMRLGQYVEWLKSNATSGGTVGRNQVYLAQWRGTDEVPVLKDVVAPPSLLRPLLENGIIDLYQTSFFVGPTGAITPLHYDPYLNLYRLHASSAPAHYAKHFTLLPPDLSHILRPGVRDRTTQRNTSLMPLYLVPKPDVDGFSEGTAEFTVCASTAAEVHTEVMAGKVMQCVLREGETLFVPRGWWHRVENVVLRGGAQGESTQEEASAGWTAGIGWWFLPRSQSLSSS